MLLSRGSRVPAAITQMQSLTHEQNSECEAPMTAAAFNGINAIQTSDIVRESSIMKNNLYKYF